MHISIYLSILLSILLSIYPPIYLLMLYLLSIFWIICMIMHLSLCHPLSFEMVQYNVTSFALSSKHFASILHLSFSDPPNFHAHITPSLLSTLSSQILWFTLYFIYFCIYLAFYCMIHGDH